VVHLVSSLCYSDDLHVEPDHLRSESALKICPNLNPKHPSAFSDHLLCQLLDSIGSEQHQESLGQKSDAFRLLQH
jgi:hypothetical protein